MRKLLAQAEIAAAEAQRDMVERCRDVVASALPQAAVEVSSDRLVVTGRDLLRNWLERAELRFIRSAKP